MNAPAVNLTKTVYETLASAMPVGVSSADLCALLDGKVDTHGVRTRLNQLAKGGYVKADKLGRGALWQTTDKKPQFRGEVAERPEDDDAVLWPRREGVQGVPPGVPNSVFALGALAATDQLSAKVAVPQPDPVHALIAEHAAQPHTLADQEPLPVFALQSDGVLLIYPLGTDGAAVELEPQVTRGLFRWLDQLGGTELGRFVAGTQTAGVAA